MAGSARAVQEVATSSFGKGSLLQRTQGIPSHILLHQTICSQRRCEDMPDLLAEENTRNLMQHLAAYWLSAAMRGRPRTPHNGTSNPNRYAREIQGSRSGLGEAGLVQESLQKQWLVKRNGRKHCTVAAGPPLLELGWARHSTESIVLRRG